MARVNWRSVSSATLSPEQVAVKLYDAAKSKAERRGLTFDLEFDEVLRRVQIGRCEVSGIKFDMRQKPRCGPDLPFRASLDRIDNTIGYCADNIQVVAKIYNQIKWTWNDDDVLELAYGLVVNSPPPRD